MLDVKDFFKYNMRWCAFLYIWRNIRYININKEVKYYEDDIPAKEETEI